MGTQESGALAGAASGAATGSAFGPWGTAIGAVVGGVAGYFGSKKSKAPAYQPLDISKVISDARTEAATNYKNSFALEAQYNPGAAALRTSTNAALQNMLSGSTQSQNAYESLLSTIGQEKVDPSVASNPLLKESTDRILSNLRLGGALGKDAQATAVQAALEKGGAAGISGSGAARGLVAKDLGLLSMDVENQRIGAAQSAGDAQAKLALQAQQLRLNDYIQRLTGAGTAVNQQVNMTSLLTGLVDSRALPSSGLDPGSIASLYIADNNAKNQINSNNAAINQQQSNQNLNAILGFGSALKSSGALDAISGYFSKKPADASGLGAV